MVLSMFRNGADMQLYQRASVCQCYSVVTWSCALRDPIGHATRNQPEIAPLVDVLLEDAAYSRFVPIEPLADLGEGPAVLLQASHFACHALW